MASSLSGSRSMMVVLVGMGALVIDIGAHYVERRELQNGADAAALAVAKDCVEGDCGSGGGSTRAQQYANLNANDGTSALDPSTPCGVGPGLTACSGSAPGGVSGATGWVRVGTSTKTSDGSSEVSFLLAPIISSLTGKTVKASAVAAWGPPQEASTLPFTFSVCEFWNLVPEGVPEGEDFPENTVTVYSKAGGGPNNEIVPECDSRSPSGGTVEGGFGWLDVSGGSCRRPAQHRRHDHRSGKSRQRQPSQEGPVQRVADPGQDGPAPAVRERLRYR